MSYMYEVRFQIIPQNGKLVSLYDNLPFIYECFMTYNTPSSAKKTSRKYKTRKSPEGQNVFSFFRPASSRLRDSSTVVFAQISSIFH